MENLSVENLTMFLKDISLVMFALKNIDELYSQGKSEVTKDIKLFKKLIKNFNLKYPNVFLVFSENGIQLKLDIFVKDNFDSAVKIAISFDDFYSINGKKTIKFPIKEDEVEITYGEINQNTLNLKKNNKIESDLVQVIYEFKDVYNKESPEFRFLSIYALKNFENLNLQNIVSFSFDTDIFEREGKGSMQVERIRLDR